MAEYWYFCLLLQSTDLITVQHIELYFIGLNFLQCFKILSSISPYGCSLQVWVKIKGSLQAKYALMLGYVNHHYKKLVMAHFQQGTVSSVRMFLLFCDTCKVHKTNGNCIKQFTEIIKSVTSKRSILFQYCSNQVIAMPYVLLVLWHIYRKN